MNRISAIKRHPTLPFLAVLALASAAVAGGLPGAVEALAYLLPPVLAVLVLVARRYPGERTILALIEHRRRRRRSRTVGLCANAPRPRAMVPRGGLLLASALAVRPPPGPSVAPS